jgi:tRNA-splicing ligase RtcB
MKQVISSEKRPIKMWLDEMEDTALQQAKNLANLPFTQKHIAIMPDSHQGFGMPIGAVLATKDVVVPNAVGVDIGCGMCALKTDIRELNKSQLKQILHEARKHIPLGFKWHENAQDECFMPEGVDGLYIAKQEYYNARKQIGSLGSGNHFVEIQKGSDGFIWLMIHSGSRNIGHKVASFYNKKAIALNATYYSSVDKSQELAFLPINTQEAKDYLAEMNYCVAFALANRKLMMERLLESVEDVVGSFGFEDLINKSHNFAAWEHHFGEELLIHRKGATRAFAGEYGMIPGSQGSHSYIVIGLGNQESFMSCSHGAGRKLGRRQAVRELDLKTEIDKLEEAGVVHAIRHKSDLDEAIGAYKDIHEVMENQKDLVEIAVELSPLAVLKG